MSSNQSLSKAIYENALNGTDKLYQLLTTTGNWEIKNKNAFSIISFIYHLFYYRINLLSKYSDNYIREILFECIAMYLAPYNISDKNKFIDECNEIFNILDTFFINSKNSKDSLSLSNIGKFFIAYVENCKTSEVYDAINSLLISTYFFDILQNSNFLTSSNNTSCTKTTENNTSFTLKVIIITLVIFSVLFILYNL